MAMGLIQGHPAFGSRVGPWGLAPTRKGVRVPRHRGVGSPPTEEYVRKQAGGVGERAEEQLAVSGARL